MNTDLRGKPKQFSVIIPLYNKQDTIKRAIDSVLAQNGYEFEIIVVDDGSIDLGVDIVEGYDDSRVHCIRQTNHGVSTARNNGWRAAHYPLISFLDADDEWEDGFLNDISSLIDQYPQAAVWGTSYWVFNGKQRTPAAIALPVGSIGILDDYFQVAADGAPVLIPSGICMHRMVLEKTGGFPEGIKNGEDLFLWARLVREYSIAYCNHPRVVYYQGAEHFLDVRKPPEPDLFGKYLLSLLRQENTRGLRHYYSNWMKMRAFAYLCLGERRNGLKAVIIALRYRPLKKSVFLFSYFILFFFPHCTTKKILNWFYREK